MTPSRLILVVAAIGGLMTVAEAAVPISDGALLNERREDSTVRVRLQDVQRNTSTATRGIRCSVTTPGRSGSVSNPTQAPQAVRGRTAIDGANPTVGTSPAFAPAPTTPSGSGVPVPEPRATAGNRADLDGSSQVAGGIIAGEEAVRRNRQTFETLQQPIGTDGTLMEALDRNSGIRTQAGMSFNQAIQSTANLTAAYNLMNLATAALMSQTGRGLDVPAAPPSRQMQQPGPLCPAGTTGQGTAQSPCVSAACSTTAYGTAPAPGCVGRRFIDTAGNVGVVIFETQANALAAPSALTADELQRALSQYHQTR
mgnify:CR=1 FL=1